MAAFAAACVIPLSARTALVADPQTLYQQMKDAYAKGSQARWTFRSQAVYLSTIFNAGRAYSLQNPDDPAYGEIATLVVQIGSALHYNPLTNHDAATWYVREAAQSVIQNSGDPTLISQANAMIARVDAEENPDQLAIFADADAIANAHAYPGDKDAMLQPVEADWRAWLLTQNPRWRSLALQHAAYPKFPVANLPTTYGSEFVTMANSANAGVEGYTATDRSNAKAFLLHLRHAGNLRVIGSVTAVPHDVYMTTLAPADEYFGRTGMSILGMRNELKRINAYLDAGWGYRESPATVILAETIDDMHKVYPRDIDMPDMLYQCIVTLGRMSTAESRTAASHLKSILTVEYQDSPQARKLLGLSG
jgi:hypothetical protein